MIWRTLVGIRSLSITLILVGCNTPPAVTAKSDASPEMPAATEMHLSPSNTLAPTPPPSRSAPTPRSSAFTLPAPTLPSTSTPLASARVASEVLEGDGACRVDADCELTSYQPGCCVQECIAHGANKKELAARKAKENCALRTRPCPPPAPCPEYDYVAKAAVCRHATCATLIERR